MTTTAEDQEMAAFVAWAVKKYGQHAYRHTSATSGEWAAWQAAAAEVATLRSQLEHWKTFAVHAEGEHAAWKKTATELDAELSKLRLDRGLVERAADMLTAYAETIRRDGASRVEEHHYLPEVEHTATELRARFVFGA